MVSNGFSIVKQSTVSLWICVERKSVRRHSHQSDRLRRLGAKGGNGHLAAGARISERPFFPRPFFSFFTHGGAVCRPAAAAAARCLACVCVSLVSV